MAFLDNSGDIILDAVLTDTGRKRMAQGTFQVSQFALGDDEIDYSLYDTTQANSAYYDLKILQTPILESFTNNMSILKSKLLTVTRTDLLYLPILKLNNLEGNNNWTPNPTYKMHLVAVDSTTEGSTTSTTSLRRQTGVILGFNTTTVGQRYIRIDQGTDSSLEEGSGQSLEAELTETSYIIEMNNQLGSITNINGVTINPNYIDDDNIASYFVQLVNNTTSGQSSNMVLPIPQRNPDNSSQDTAETVLQGKRGTKLQFSIKASTNLTSGVTLFDRLGGNQFTYSSRNYKFIDTNIRVTGVLTGYRIDVPVRFVKQV